MSYRRRSALQLILGVFAVGFLVQFFGAVNAGLERDWWGLGLHAVQAPTMLVGCFGIYFGYLRPSPRMSAIAQRFKRK